MCGGELRIIGEAGDYLGTALPGDRHGMRDGVVIVGGAAGAGVGDRMRRGLIAIMATRGAVLRRTNGSRHDRRGR